MYPAAKNKDFCPWFTTQVATIYTSYRFCVSFCENFQKWTRPPKTKIFGHDFNTRERYFVAKLIADEPTITLTSCISSCDNLYPYRFRVSLMTRNSQKWDKNKGVCSWFSTRTSFLLLNWLRKNRVITLTWPCTQNKLWQFIRKQFLHLILWEILKHKDFCPRFQH